jgi:hypothetical protein
MPRVKKNSLVKGLAGNFRKEFVYKMKGDETFLVGMPVLDKNRPRTANEIAFRQRSTSALAYAKDVMADPVLKAFYDSKATRAVSAFNLAFKDFQNKPYVYDIDTTKYTGAIGSQIGVEAFDDGKVTGVSIRITSAGGDLLEFGEAIYNARKGAKWYYTTTQNNPVLPGTRITAVVRDLPENEGFMDKTL